LLAAFPESAPAIPEYAFEEQRDNSRSLVYACTGSAWGEPTERPMGLKSTVTLNRAEAEETFVDLWLERKRKKARVKAAALNDKELESVIECWDQKASDGESFRKYLIER
jgi:hypothetical protein